MAPYESNIGKIISGPMTVITAKMSMAEPSSLEFVFVKMARVAKYACRKGAWYISTIPMVPGLSMGASLILITSAAADCFNYLEV